MRVKSEHLFGFMVIATALAIFLGGRPKLPADTPRIEAIARLPESPKLEAVRRYTEYGSGILPYNSRELRDRERRRWSLREPLQVGYSYREISFFGLPLWAYPEYGLVTFIEQPVGFQIAIMRSQQVELLGELTGRDWSGYSFAVWKHLWGWLIPLGFLAAVFLYLREAKKRREEEGVY